MGISDFGVLYRHPFIGEERQELDEVEIIKLRSTMQFLGEARLRC